MKNLKSIWRMKILWNFAWVFQLENMNILLEYTNFCIRFYLYLSTRSEMSLAWYSLIAYFRNYVIVLDENFRKFVENACEWMHCIYCAQSSHFSKVSILLCKFLYYFWLLQSLGPGNAFGKCFTYIWDFTVDYIFKILGT